MSSFAAKDSRFGSPVSLRSPPSVSSETVSSTRRPFHSATSSRRRRTRGSARTSEHALCSGSTSRRSAASRRSFDGSTGTRRIAATTSSSSPSSAGSSAYGVLGGEQADPAAYRRALHAIPGLEQPAVRFDVPADPALRYGARLLWAQWRDNGLGPRLVSGVNAQADGGLQRIIAAYPQEEALTAQLVFEDARRAAGISAPCTRRGRAARRPRTARCTVAPAGLGDSDRLGRGRAARLAAARRLARGCPRERRLRGGQIPGFEPTPVIVKRSAAIAGVSRPYA